MSSYSRQQLESWLKDIDVKANRVLDVGGAQLLTKGRTKSWEVEDYILLDLIHPHNDNHEVQIRMDLNFSWEQLSREELGVVADKFDVIFCTEVSEYWFNPYEAIRNLNKLTKKNGLLYISFHFIYPVHNPVNQDFLRYTPQGARRLLEKGGFDIESVSPRLDEPKEGFDSIMKFFSGQGMRPSKEWDKHNWVGFLIKARKIREL